VTAWREGWEPFDPLRPCYTCGKDPVGWFDRARNEPLYHCIHEPFITDDPPRPRWASKATREEWDYAYKRAARILKENDEAGRQTKFTLRFEQRLDTRARSIVAELVAARLTGLPFNAEYLKSGYRRSRKKADIGHVEVRNTRDHLGDLAIYPNDPDRRVVLLVTGVDPFVLRGWIFAGKGSRRDLYKPFKGDTGEMQDRWMVPQDLLEPMGTMPLA
jgi:hypothetical protein